MSKKCPSQSPPSKPGFTPGAECVCPPTPTPSPTASPTPSPAPYQCRYEWMCTYDCQGTPPGWNTPGKTGQFCVLFDDCINSLWWYDDSSSTARLKVYRKTTCEWVCEDDSDCFDHTPVTPPAPNFVPVQCPTPTPTDEPTVTPTDEPTATPTDEPTGTPTPTPIDPDQYYCICYCLYYNNDCTGELVGAGYDCLKGNAFVEGCGGFGVYITIIGGPFPTWAGCSACDWDCPTCP